MVLILDENIPRDQWCLGSVVLVHKAKDRHERSAVIKTRSDYLTRLISKLCFLRTFYCPHEYQTLWAICNKLPCFFFPHSLLGAGMLRTAIVPSGFFQSVPFITHGYGSLESL